MLPTAPLVAAILATLLRLAPCPDGASCDHARAAVVVATVAASWADVATLGGIGAHETGFRTRRQTRGPAVSWWQIEAPRAEREALLADDFAAASRALAIARRCPSLRCYAFGSPRRGTRRQEATAAQLRACVASAERGGAWKCRAWR